MSGAICMLCLKYVLKPLRIISITLQSNQTTLADVDEKMTVGVLESYKDSPEHI